VAKKETRQDVEKVFRLFDEKKTGKIGLRNLREVALEIGEQMTDEELLKMIERADSDGDGLVTSDDLYNILVKKPH
jgi:centrin-3